MKDVKFESARSTLKPQSGKILGEIADILKRYPYYDLQIDGHTDSQGKEEANQKLSELRAQSCADFLTGKGVEKERFIVNGFGETKPIADNKTAAGRSLNRRVEFELILRDKSTKN